jgi:hypothetical protein
VLSGSRSKVETLGLESLFTEEVIANFLGGTKQYAGLPKLTVEVFFNHQNDPDLYGNFNSEHRMADGLQLCCEPDNRLSQEINLILQQKNANFPFEYYTVNFNTFSGQQYTSYRKFLRHVLIDSSQINNEYATKKYVKDMYESVTQDVERYKHLNEYRNYKADYSKNVLSSLNSRTGSYQFGVRSSSKANLATDIILNEGNINIENKGKGKQCFIKTDFALKRTGTALDAILLEEPENHLSHIHMKKLIDQIRGTNNKQLFLSTHNSLISTRLNLKKSILLNSNATINASLKNVKNETAEFFMKAPDNNVIEFVLSNKVILVEGDAEFILMEEFFLQNAGRSLDSAGVHVISVDGTSFKRYLELADVLKIKTAVITDNDGSYQKNCLDNYKDFTAPNIKIFADADDTRKTFELCMYADNKAVCDSLFASGRRTLTVEEHMLANKTEVAFELLTKKGQQIVAPDYIKQAIRWINA